MDISNLRFDDYFMRATPSTSLTDEVIIFEREQPTSKHILNPETMPPVRLEDSVIFVLCRYGEALFSVNDNSYRLSKGSALVLSNKHIIDNIQIDNNCEAFVLIISQNLFMSCIRDTPYIQKMMEAMNKPIDLFPFLQLNENEMCELDENVMHIKKYLKKSDHVFQNQMVRNETCNFILELANIYLLRLGIEEKKEKKQKHKDEIMLEFFKLIALNFKEQHEVAFYSDKLCITPITFTRNIVATTGKTPIQLISSALVTEAKILLRKPDVSVKQVADDLHFGDQSSFGKFFKKHTGLTPMEYKNKSSIFAKSKMETIQNRR